MEQRPKKTLGRTLSLVATSTKIILISALFLPALFAFKQFSEQSNKPPVPSVATLAETFEKHRPRELVKVYSIVRSHRPDVSDSEAWSVSEVILGESSKRNLDPLLVLALIRVESDFQYTAVSPRGARGL